MTLLEQVRRDIDKLEDRGLANMSDLQLLTNLLLSEKCLTERRNDDTYSEAREVDRDINALYLDYLEKRKACIKDMRDETSDPMINALHELLEEVTDLLYAVYKSALLPEERDEIKQFYGKISRYDIN